MANSKKIEDYRRRLFAYKIARYIIVIFGIIMVVIAIGGIINSKLNIIELFSSVTAIFSGWIAAVIGYFFNEERLGYEHEVNDKMRVSERKNTEGEVIKRLNEKPNDNTIMTVNQVPLSKIKKIRLDEQIGNAFTLIYKNNYDYIPVVDKNDKLKRIFSKTDLSNYIMNVVNSIGAGVIKEKELKDLADKWNNDTLLDEEEEIKRQFDKSIIEAIKDKTLPKAGLISVKDYETVAQALNRIFKEDKNSLPIVDRNDTLKGIITKTDFIKYFMKIQKEM